LLPVTSYNDNQKMGLDQKISWFSESLTFLSVSSLPSESAMNDSEKKSAGSVTLLLEGLCAVDETKTKEFWDLFFPRLVRVANQILRCHQDAEDAAQEALVKFWTRATKDHEPFDMDRYGIWAFLSKITVRQALDFLKNRSRKKRGGGKVLLESDLGSLVGQDWDLDCVIGDLSFCSFDVVLDELLGSFSEETRSLLVWKMMGYTNQEIANRLGCSEKHIRRKIQRIREEFQHKNLDPAEDGRDQDSLYT
jgi:RNA polymerase sigma factor (sigma-70 family)